MPNNLIIKKKNSNFLTFSLKREKQSHVKKMSQMFNNYVNATQTKLIQVYSHHCGVTFNILVK